MSLESIVSNLSQPPLLLSFVSKSWYCSFFLIFIETSIGFFSVLGTILVQKEQKNKNYAIIKLSLILECQKNEFCALIPEIIVQIAQKTEHEWTIVGLLRQTGDARWGVQKYLPSSQSNQLFQYNNPIVFVLIQIFSNNMYHALRKLQQNSVLQNIIKPLSLTRRPLVVNGYKTSSFLSNRPQFMFSSYYGASQNTAQLKQKEQIYDFGLFDDSNAHIESMIILNNELNYKLLSRSMNLTQNVVLADGGANHLYELEEHRQSSKIKALVGDFDCIKPEVLDFYNDLRIPVQYLSNPDFNDFAKSIEYCLENNWREIFVFGAFGGRMDQTLSYMHYCEKYSKLYPELRITLFGQSNLMHFMKPNITHKIRCNEKFISKYGCGIISFGEVDEVETKGFKYNLGPEQKYSSIEWGKFISTSNSIVDSECSIKGNDNLFFVANYSKEMLN